MTILIYLLKSLLAQAACLLPAALVFYYRSNIPVRLINIEYILFILIVSTPFILLGDYLLHRMAWQQWYHFAATGIVSALLAIFAIMYSLKFLYDYPRYGTMWSILKDTLLYLFYSSYLEVLTALAVGSLIGMLHWIFQK